MMVNYFTKEELLILLIDIENNSRIKPSQKIVALTNKLKLMIDHYCEHKNEYVDSNYFSGCWDCGKKW